MNKYLKTIKENKEKPVNTIPANNLLTPDFMEFEG
jgi:hypothetical protein